MDGTFIHLYTTKGHEEEFRDMEAKKSENETQLIQMDVLDYIEAKSYVDKDGSPGLELRQCLQINARLPQFIRRPANKDNSK